MRKNAPTLVILESLSTVTAAPNLLATLLLPAGLTSRTSIAYKDEDKLLGKAVDEESTDNIYINEVLPAKMRYNLESMKHFGVQADASVLWDTFTSVVGSERMTIKK